MEIGSKLKTARLEKQLTQENVANILNLSRSTISSWEVGRSYPDLDNLANKEIESNSFMAPDSFSDETKVFLIENVREGTTKLVGTIGTLTK